MQDAREVFIKRLKEDLIGPLEGENGILFGRPSGHYLTGIVYPRETRIPGSEQDDTEEVHEGKDKGDDSTEVGVSGFRRFKPCTAGVSFAISGDTKKETIGLKIRFGRYHQEDFHGLILFYPDSKDNPKHEPDKCWRRIQHEVIKKVKLNQDAKKITLKGPGLENLEIFLRRKCLEDCSIVTVQVINAFKPEKDDDFSVIDENSLFQFSLSVSVAGKTVFHPRKPNASDSDEDNRISNLIYRDVREFATGHNCSATWSLDDKTGDCIEVKSTWMPTEEVKPIDHSGDKIFQNIISQTPVGNLSAQAMYESSDVLLELSTAVSDAYDSWIDEQIKRIGQLDKQFVEQAKANMEKCRSAGLRIKEGIQYLAEQHDARKAFQIANLVMRVQRSWSDGQPDWQQPNGADLIWRPFQLAFVLMCIPSSSERRHEDRNILDLLWFPTGGGKTEAYLLLSAYTLILRRMRNPQQAAGLSVVMRYTLRTLTVQQYQRAAAMITACEAIRTEKYSKLLGQERFSIGLWVGEASTPNKLPEAYKALNREVNPTSTPAQIKTCPRCNSALSWHSSGSSEKVSVTCTNENCRDSDLFKDLPFLAVDEQIYAEVPSLLIGTVDKFAQITRNEPCGNLFGIASDRLPPDLIIQDELHLISGPLGSLTGIYELAIDELCRTEEGRAKIIGSTATIRRAEEQVRALFDREAFQFPPAAIDAHANGFAKTDDDSDGRLYVGLSSAGRSRKIALQAIAASLLQTGKSIEVTEGRRKFYETLVSYYISLRELGGALVVMQDAVPDSIKAIAKRRSEEARRLSIPEELTSRKASSEIPVILNSLARESSEDGFIDILLASNMLSVGVDIPRLGLMLVNGQPKSMTEYIQATSRVGRTSDGPGLVVILYNDGKIRDKAHFETFKTWHSSLYRSVEASSVTPFASRARDKALHAPLVALARHKLGMKNVKLMDTEKSRIIKELLPAFEARINRIDKRETQASLKELNEFLDYWQECSGLKYFWNEHKKPSDSLLISAEKEAAREASGQKRSPAKSTPNSLRNVEPSTLFKLREHVWVAHVEEKSA